MDVSFFLADFCSGRLLTQRLPLQAVRLASGLEPGAMSAELDLRRVVRSVGSEAERFADAAVWLDLLRGGRCSLVPVLENNTRGTMTPVDLTFGEWWVNRVDVRHSSPIITLGGVEWAGYLRHQTTAHTWGDKQGSVDSVLTAREVIHDAAMGQTPPVRIDVNRGSTSALRTAGFWPARSVVSADLLRDLGAGTEWEWLAKPSVVSVDGVPDRIERSVLLSAPRLLLGEPDNLPLEIKEPGQTRSSGLDVTVSEDVDALTSEMWSWGAGTGGSQVRSGVVEARPTGVPVLARLVTDPTVPNGPAATVLARKALAAMRRERFTVTVDAARMVPTVGGRRWVSRSPSLSMPVADTFVARVVEWSWSQHPHGLDVFDVTMERV